MATGIPYADETLNVTAGCTKCSPGCLNCYAEKMAHRLKHICLATNNNPQYLGKTDDDGHWTGKVECCPWLLDQPLKWRNPRRIFVCSMSDLFHEKVPFEFIDKVFKTMIESPQHIYLILTKRPQRMAEWVKDYAEMYNRFFKGRSSFESIGNTVHLGISISTQKEADEKIPILLQIPAAVRWLSIEPMLEKINPRHINIRPDLYLDTFAGGSMQHIMEGYGLIDGVVVGGESGPGARPMHPDWVRNIRDQCVAAGVPFYFKQWGNYFPDEQFEAERNARPGSIMLPWAVPDRHIEKIGGKIYYRVGKKKAGCILDGKEWKQLPDKEVWISV